MTNQQKQILADLQALADEAAAKAKTSGHPPIDPHEKVARLTEDLASRFYTEVTMELMKRRLTDKDFSYGDALYMILRTSIMFVDISTYQAFAMMRVNDNKTREDFIDMKASLLKDLDATIDNSIRQAIKATGKGQENGGGWL